MVYLMLNDLYRPAGEGSDASLEFGSLPFDFDGMIAFAFAGASEQLKTTFFCIIRS